MVDCYTESIQLKETPKAQAQRKSKNKKEILFAI